MEEILEKLIILNYDQSSSYRPLTRSSFSIPARNPDEQFHLFGSLVSWLSSILGHQFQPPSLTDDPNAATTDILTHLRNLGFNMDFPPSQIKQGWGDAVCTILNSLCDLALAHVSHQFQPPVFAAEEEETPDSGDVEEGGLIDETEGVETDDEDDAPVLLGGAPPRASKPGPFALLAPSESAASPFSVLDSKPAHASIEPANVATTVPVDVSAWRMEVERVAPRLKIRGHLQGAKDWRAHLELMNQHLKAFRTMREGITPQLHRVATEVQHDIDRILSRERFFNSQFEHLTAQHHEVAKEHDAVAGELRTAGEAVTELQNQLQDSAEAVDTVKTQLDEHGSSISNTGPLMRIKKAYAQLKGDIKQMNLRIGILQSSLFRACVDDADRDLSDDEFIDEDEEEEEEEEDGNSEDIE